MKHARIAAATTIAACTSVAACSFIAGVSGDVEIVSAPDDAQRGDASSDDARTQDRASEDGGLSDADADPGQDAQPASDIPDGGMPPDASVVFCGQTACTNKQEVCCYTASDQTCQSAIGPNCAGGSTARCDETSDCDAGEVCCVTSVHTEGLETTCKPSCGPTQPRACRVNSECPGRDCVPWACANGVVETCGGAGADAGCSP